MSADLRELIAEVLANGGPVEDEYGAAEAVLAALGPVGREIPLNDYDLWTKVAEQIGKHDFTYDLGDDSHRLDVVQIVCEALAKVVYP